METEGTLSAAQALSPTQPTNTPIRRNGCILRRLFGSQHKRPGLQGAALWFSVDPEWSNGVRGRAVMKKRARMTLRAVRSSPQLSGSLATVWLHGAGTTTTSRCLH